MKTIPLSRGFTALVDDWNYERLMGMGPWHCDDHGTVLYAVRWGYNPNTGKMGSVTMSNCIKDPSPGFTWDHIDGNGLNNQEDNLRLASMAQQVANQGMRKTNTSGYKGIYFQKTSRKWIAQIKINGKGKHLGLFSTKEEAALAYNEAAKLYFGDFARLNEVV